MKFDITKLPVGEMMVGFLLLVLAVTFVGAFSATGDGGGGPAASASPGGSPSASAGPTASGGGGGNSVTMTDNKFDPTQLSVSAGASVTIQLTNKGTAIHNMRIAGPDGKFNSSDDAVSNPQLIPGGQTATLTWTAPTQAGDIIFQCDFHPTDMKGTITVK